MNTLFLDNLSDDHVRLLNQISLEIKDDFNNLIKEAYKKTGLGIDWLVSSTLSRNPYLSSIFKHCAQLVLILIILEENPGVSRIITSSPELNLVLRNYIKEKKLDKEIICSLSLRERAKRILKPFYHFWSNSFLCFVMCLSSDKAVSDAETQEAITLIDTFILDDSLRNGVWEDRYFPGLLDPLNEKERRTVYFAPHINNQSEYLKTCRQLRKSNNQFLFKADFLKLSDYSFALFRSFRVRKVSFAGLKFRGIDVAPFFDADYRINRNNPSSFHGLLNHRFVRNLKHNGIKLRLVIEWFENQVIDRGLIKGIRQYYPGTRVVGYQGFIISRDYNLHLTPIDDEVRAGVIPDIISVVGEALKKELERNVYGLKVDVAPAFRFSHIFQSDDQTYCAGYKKKLVVLPIGIEESSDIMHLLGQMVKENYLKRNELVIKPHPVLDTIKLNKRLREYNLENYTVTQEPIQQCFRNTDCVISNTSSVCVEALSYGLPVIIIGNRKGITQNPIPKSVPPLMWGVCYNSEDILDSLDKFVETRKNNNFVDSFKRKIREDYFEPVTARGIREFLKMN